jgi:hypothetical protein
LINVIATAMYTQSWRQCSVSIVKPAMTTSAKAMDHGYDLRPNRSIPHPSVKR